jgi:hypothetical protein
MAVDFPPEYQQARTVTAVDPRGQSGPAYPLGVMIRHDADVHALCVVVVLSNGTSITRILRPLPGVETIEQGNLFEPELYPDSIAATTLPHTADEADLAHRAARIAVNAMLLLMDRGCCNLGPDNRTAAERLDRQIDKARRRGDAEMLDRNLAERATIPTLFGLANPPERIIVVADRATVSGEGEAIGRLQSPHWRRGHWRMQAYGPGMTLRRRVLIRPVLVNSHLLAEGQFPGMSTYRKG